jgi:hypothetical protein
MQLSFTAGDAQSSLKKLEWTVVEDVGTAGEACKVCTPESNTIHLGGHCPATDATDRDCLCTPHGACLQQRYLIPVHKHQELKNGVHSRGYTFTVTATNRAGLENTHSFRVFIDTTPPVRAVPRLNLRAGFPIGSIGFGFVGCQFT